MIHCMEPWTALKELNQDLKKVSQLSGRKVGNPISLYTVLAYTRGLRITPALAGSWTILHYLTILDGCRAKFTKPNIPIITFGTNHIGQGVSKVAYVPKLSTLKVKQNNSNISSLSCSLLQFSGVFIFV